MYQTARPIAATRPTPHAESACPECGTPVTGIATTEPGVHEFVGCGHRASARELRSLAE